MNNESRRRGYLTDLDMTQTSAGEGTFGQGSEAYVRVHLFVPQLRVSFRKWSKIRVFFKKNSFEMQFELNKIFTVKKNKICLTWV